MKIWIFNNYNMKPDEGPLNRHYNFAQQLVRLGHKPVVFVGSHLHNTNIQKITDKRPFQVEQDDRLPWVYVRTCTYGKSRKKQVWSMFQYYWNAKKAAKKFAPPDVILGSSAHMLAAVLAIRLAKKYHCKSIVEIRDLWPESIVAYGIAGSKNPVILLLRRLEKWIYQKADIVIFTMEGAYDYIVQQGWEKEIPRSKVHYLNNGVDLEQFHYNRDHYQLDDPDLDNPEIFKVVYTGSIRKANHVGLILDTAKKISSPNIRFLIWGAGDEVDALQQRLVDETITNVVLKGKVDKKYIPSIVSRANLNLMHLPPHPIFNYGISPNKLFDYLAAEKPVLCDFPCAYNPAVQQGAGILVNDANSEQIALAVEQMSHLPPERYQDYCEAALKAAQAYDFQTLTQKLIDIIEGTC